MSEETIAGFGWVVDDDAPAKLEAGGPAEFAQQIASGQRGACDAGTCPTCELLDERGACVGVIEPISQDAEHWLAQRLPVSLESLPGQLLRQNLKEGAVSGKGGERLRAAGMMKSAKAFQKNYGPFFRGVSITTDQIIEEMLCAGDIQPAHALAVLVHLGGIAIDDDVPMTATHGARLADVMKKVADREERTLCTIAFSDDDDASTVQLKRFLRALYAAFVQDTEVRVFG